MIAALLTVMLFAFSGVAGERSARYWGGQQANLLRLLLATGLMGAVTLTVFRDSVRPETVWWLLASGVVGFGIGDIALFLAYVRIGARLTILLNLCTAPLWSAALERVWLGTRLSPTQLLAGAVILSGVAIALAARPSTAVRGSRLAGVLCGLVAGCGQGLGAVISRKAFEVADASGFALNGFSAAAQRVAGGCLTALLFVAVLAMVGRTHSRPRETTTRSRAWAWLAATTLCGPVLGVSAFQWSLLTLPAGVTTALTATSPVAMIPLVMWLDRERPPLLSVAGSCVAVAGVILMVLA